MKFLLIPGVLILFGLPAIAQDTIKKKEGDSVKVMEEYFQMKSIHPSKIESNSQTPPQKRSRKKADLFTGKNELESLINSGNSENNLSTRIQGPSQFDSRIELRQLLPLDEEWKKNIIYNAASVGIVIEKSMIQKVDDSLWLLDAGTSLGQRFNLCPTEAFCKQPVVGFGTAFFIDNETMITAGHVFDTPFRDLIVLFGFEISDDKNGYKTLYQSSEVYEISKIENRSSELDVALFKLDRPANRSGLRIPSKNQLVPDLSVYMIGHPSGLPKKVALNAEVTNNANPLFFYTSLDAFQGNSGSPVFDFETHELIGVLVSGNVDYKWNGSCRETTLFHLDQTDGEKVIRIEAILEELRE